MRSGGRVRPRAVVAVSTAAVGFGSIIGFAPVGSGAFIDAAGSYTWAWFADAVVLVAAAVSYRMAGRTIPLAH